MTNPGERRHYLSLQIREDRVNAMNSPIANPDWLEVIPLWGKIEPLSGTEYNQALQNKSRANLKINTLFFENFNGSQSTNMRFMDLLDGRIYNIEFTKNPDQWRDEIDWFVREDTTQDAA